MAQSSTPTGDTDFSGLVLAGKWRVTRHIATSNASVWLCEDDSSRVPRLPPRAAKFIPDDGRVGRLHEIELLKDMRPSEHLVYLHDIDRVSLPAGDFLVLLLEYCDGGSLRHPISSAECGRLASHLLSALERLHSGSRRIIHADIKPGNVLRAGDDWKLADFDIAKPMRTGALSATNDGRQTPDFAAPGQGHSDHRITPADDVYSLGATIHWALTGEPLIRRENDDPILATSLPPEWTEFVRQACRLAPERRSTIARLCQLIPTGATLRTAPTFPAVAPLHTAPTEHRISPGAARRKGKRRRLLVTAATLALAAIGASATATRVVQTVGLYDARGPAPATGPALAHEGSSDAPEESAETDRASSTTSLAPSSTLTTTPADTRPDDVGAREPSTASERPEPAETAPATTAPRATTTMRVNRRAEDRAAYLRLTGPVNCAFIAFAQEAALPSPAYWGDRTFTDSWSELRAAKPLLRAWITAIDGLDEQWDSVVWADTDPRIVREDLVMVRDLLTSIADAPSGWEADLAIENAPDGLSWFGVMGRLSASAAAARDALGLPPLKTYAEDGDKCTDAWLV